MIMDRIEFSENRIAQWSRLGSRAVYGQALLEIAHSAPKVIAISADLGNSSGLDRFKSSFPDRFVNVGIAEQNMIGVAAGLAKEGFNVFASSFAPFISLRAGEQIRMNLGYMQHNVKAVGIGSGLSMGFLGNSHFGTEDLAVMLSIPNLTVIAPSDTTEVVKVIEQCAMTVGPMYIRLTGAPGDPLVNKTNYDFTIGKAISLREGSDVSLIASGSMVHVALSAAEILASVGISASVTNLHTLKPLDLEHLNSLHKKGAPIYTIEEHSVVGGLGSVVSSYLSEKRNPTPVIKIGLPDAYGETGDYSFLKNKYGLNGVAISERVKSELSNYPRHNRMS
jgi:transketolase